MITFTKKDKNLREIVVLSTYNDHSLDYILEVFTDFLRASGYVIGYDKCLLIESIDNEF